MIHFSHTFLAATSLAMAAGYVVATGIAWGQDIAGDAGSGHFEFAIDPVALMTLPVGPIESIRGSIPCSPLVMPRAALNAGISARASYIVGDRHLRSTGLRALSISVGYDDLTSLFESSPNDSYEGYDPINDAYRRIATRQSVQFTLRSIRAALELEFALGGVILLRGGPSCGIPLSGSSRELDVVLSPSNATFLDRTQQREITEGTGDLQGVGIRLGMGAALACRLPLGRHLFLEPTVGADMGLTAMQPSWTPLLVRGGISLGYALFPSRTDSPVPVVAAIAGEIQPPPEETAFTATPTIDVAGDGRPIRLRRQIVARYVPLLPTIFFDKDSAAIPSRYVLNHAGPRDDFDEGMLPGNAEEAHRHILDVIGKRLSEHHRARLTITGTTSTDEENRPTLARRRADAVAEYLIDRWGIDRRRLTITSRVEPAVPSNSEHPEGRQENRRVEIASSQDELERPVQIRSVEPTIEPREIAFMIGATASSRIERWRVDIVSGIMPAKAIEGMGSPAGIVRWELNQADRERMLSGDDVLYRLTIHDSAGRTAGTAPRSLRLQLDTTVSIASAPGRLDNSAEFLLLTFEFDRSELARRGMKDIAAALERIGPGSTVSIIGYTDSTGELEHNRMLALDRARRVATMMPKGIGVDYRGASPDEAPYGSASPEGRFLSRTVRIIVTDPK